MISVKNKNLCAGNVYDGRSSPFRLNWRSMGLGVERVGRSGWTPTYWVPSIGREGPWVIRVDVLPLLSRRSVLPKLLIYSFAKLLIYSFIHSRSFGVRLVDDQLSWVKGRQTSLYPLCLCANSHFCPGKSLYLNDSGRRPSGLSEWLWRWWVYVGPSLSTLLGRLNSPPLW